MDRTVRYVESGGVQLAYEIVSEGERDILFVTEWGVNLDALYEEPMEWARLGYAAMGRLITFNLRGTGFSDRVEGLPSLEEWVEDVRAVMVAANSASACLVLQGHAAQLGLLFAAMYPEMVESLVIINGYARLARDVDYPAGYPPKARAALVQGIRNLWGTGLCLAVPWPALAAEPDGIERLARYERQAGPPNRNARVMAWVLAIDVRDVLPSISVPTLVIHARDDTYAPMAHGRYLADHIPGARFFDYPGVDHSMGDIRTPVDRARFLSMIGDFIESPRPATSTTRALRTIAFTDIVDSTRRAVALGDTEWRALLKKHTTAAKRHVERANGRVVKFTGDGMMATFDGPAKAIECLRDLAREMERAGLPIRSGVHTGEVELIDDDLGGIGVHIAARVSAKAGSGEIFVSSTVRDLVVGSELQFKDQGFHELKGIPGEWNLLSVAS